MSTTRVRVSELVKELVGDGKVLRSPCESNSIMAIRTRRRLEKAGSDRRKEGLVEAKAFQKQFVSIARKARWEKTVDQLSGSYVEPLLTSTKEMARLCKVARAENSLLAHTDRRDQIFEEYERRERGAMVERGTNVRDSDAGGEWLSPQPARLPGSRHVPARDEMPLAPRPLLRRESPGPIGEVFIGTSLT